jgi:hypothetical protein
MLRCKTTKSAQRIRVSKNCDSRQREAIPDAAKRLCCSAFAIRHANVYIPSRRNFAKILHAMRGQGAEIAWP